MSELEKWQHLNIPFGEIEEATENFQTLIGQGAYGFVYKGKLLVSGKETMVAVKRLKERSKQGLKEFLTEVDLLARQQHPNLVSLVGFCYEEKEMSIVYEYVERGSLDQYIRRSNSITLTWLQRLKICIDVARGLDHLHHNLDGGRMIIHRDIKSHNILIDENWVAKISDLGLSKLGLGTTITKTDGGTTGYIEPEYSNTGIVSRKSDVYSFGVVLFEVLCGRLCNVSGNDQFMLTSKSAKYQYKNNTLNKFIDQSLREYIGSDSMTVFAAIAYRCLDDDREHRPAMDIVLKELKEALKLQHDNMSDRDGMSTVFEENESFSIHEVMRSPVFSEDESSDNSFWIDLGPEPMESDYGGNKHRGERSPLPPLWFTGRNKNKQVLSPNQPQRLLIVHYMTKMGITKLECCHLMQL